MQMRVLTVIIFLSVNLIFAHTNYAQDSNRKYAKIQLVDKSSEFSRTFISNMNRKDFQRLNSGYAYSPSEADIKKNIRQNNKESEDYVNRVTSGKNKRKKSKEINEGLYGNKKIRDKKSYNTLIEDREIEREEKLLENRKKRNRENSSKNVLRSNRNISKYYTLRGRRIFNGQTFKKTGGNVNLVVKYKVKEDNYINTYVTTVQDYIKPGSKYNLKYHGVGSNRKYYLEYVSKF